MSVSFFRKISPEDILEHDNAIAVLEKIDNLIEERIGYIIHFISSEMKYSFSNWGFIQDDYYHEKTMKDWFFEKENEISEFSFDPIMGKDGQYCFYAMIGDQEYRIDWNSNQRRFPKRWVFEDFEEEFLVGRKRFLEEHLLMTSIRKTQTLAKIQKKQEKLKQSLEKLQKEENELTSRFVKVGPHQFASENK
jgi:hypothetical protein